MSNTITKRCLIALLFLLCALPCSAAIIGGGSWDSGAAETFYVGKQTTPIDGDQVASSDVTYISPDNPSTKSGTVTKIEVFVEADGSGSLKVALFTKSGSVFTPTDVVTLTSVGEGTLTFNAPSDFTAFDIESDEYVGFYGLGGGSGTGVVVSRQTGVSGSGYYSYSGDGTTGETTFGTGDLENEKQLQIRITVSE